MQFGILKTDNGPHPADKWAASTARQITEIIVVDENATSPDAVLARKLKPRLELNIADALECHHTDIISKEQEELSVCGSGRYHVSCDALDHYPQTIAEALVAVQKCTDATPYAAHFRSPDGAALVVSILRSHFGTVMDIERKWHRDRAIQTAAIAATA